VTSLHGTILFANRSRYLSLPVVLEPQLLAYLRFVEPYDDLTVYDGGGGGLGVDLDHLLHGVEVGADVLFGELYIILR
jgi:hypothetical protein